MPGKLNINYVLYTAFRLSPFIIVCFFALSSILNQDLKGVIFLAGLLFACFFAILISSGLTGKAWFNGPPVADGSDSTNAAICNTLSLSDSGRVSSIPLGMVVFSFTFFYLVDIIAKYDLAKQNVPTLVIFPIIIIAEAVWNRQYQCATFIQLIFALGVGSLCGFGWAQIIRKTGAVQLQYFNGISNTQTCSRPSKQKFKCKINTK